jgi:hypothetical protein
MCKKFERLPTTLYREAKKKSSCTFKWYTRPPAGRMNLGEQRKCQFCFSKSPLNNNELKIAICT